MIDSTDACTTCKWAKIYRSAIGIEFDKVKCRALYNEWHDRVTYCNQQTEK